jgi:hypothetical protein
MHIETLNALSMLIPGMLLSIWWTYTTKHIEYIPIATITYTISSICSYLYHCKNRDFGYHAKYLRLDILGQQIVMFMSVIMSPYSISGLLVLTPLITIVYCADFTNTVETDFALYVHALCILIIAYYGSPYSSLMWLGAFYIYSIDSKYAKIFWHFACHLAIHRTWSDWLAAL